MLKLSRRKLLFTVCGCAAAASGVGYYTWRIEPHWVEFAARQMPLQNLPAHWVNKRIVHISDLHVGNIVDDDYLIETFRAVDTVEADIVAITGDFVSYRSSQQYDQLARVLEQIPHGKTGTIGVLGNHDYGYGWQQSSVGDEITKRAENAGITILRNQQIELDGLRIGGMDDLWGPHFDPQTMWDESTVNNGIIHGIIHGIILCHNPDAADMDIWAGFQGWILSGHTHGGQCKPPFLPPPLLPVQNRHYTAGQFNLSDGRHLYINRGLGYLMRVRFNARPEVTVFTLVNQVV